MDEKTKYEPSIALYAKDNGLYFYNIIFKRYKEYLNNSYFLSFEINSNTSYEVLNLANKYFKDSKIWIEKDLNNRDRYLFITNYE